MARQNISELVTMLEAALSEGVFPAAQACVISRGERVHSSAHGRDHEETSITPSSLFDVASVTKLAATTLATASLIASGELTLETTVASVIPGFAGASRESITLRELLAHGSGLPAWDPFFAHCVTDERAGTIFPNPNPSPSPRRDFAASRDVVVSALLATELTAHRGQRVYSDLGFMVLGLVLEAASGLRLPELCRQVVFDPLGLKRTGFFPLDRDGDAWWCLPGTVIAPTGLTRPREPAPGQESLYSVPDQSPEVVVGEVDDDNAYAMGGVAGHAGLFSTAEELAGLGWAVIEELDGAERLAAGEVLGEFARPDTTTAGARRGLGFDIPASEGSLAGSLLGKAGPKLAIGHLGFTGCSLWLDLDRELVIALLSNRVFPTRANVEPMRRFRPAFHDAVVRGMT